MKNFPRFLLCAVALGALAWPGQAVMIGGYPGLEALIKEADTIAIVRVEGASSGLVVNGWTRRSCYVYQTLKGTLKINERVLISLNRFVGTRSDFGESLAPMSTHLVFLNRSETPINGANYSIIGRQGADLPVSPLGNETKPAGKTLKAQIQTLIRRYQNYRAAQTKREDAMLNKALAE